MAISGKGGGRRKVFYTATCQQRVHGRKGLKSASSHFFVGTAMPRHMKRSHHTGCPQCRAERGT